MVRLRRILGPITATWLACQVAGLTAAPMVFWIAAPADVVGCTCAHGDHAMCPMHHRPASGTRCAMQATHGGGTAILSTLLSGVGIITPVTVAVVPAPITAVSRFDLRPASFRPAPPDPPPPRD
jgi:hypothetical protein